MIFIFMLMFQVLLWCKLSPCVSLRKLSPIGSQQFFLMKCISQKYIPPSRIVIFHLNHRKDYFLMVQPNFFFNYHIEKSLKIEWKLYEPECFHVRYSYTFGGWKGTSGIIWDLNETLVKSSQTFLKVIAQTGEGWKQ